MILSLNGIIAGRNVDNAQLFIDAASITDVTQQNAIRKLVFDLKSCGVWYKTKAIYPFVGGTASSHRFNLKDPRTVSAAFYLDFYGGGTHSANGYQPDGATAYADTRLNENSVITLGSEHISFYSRTDILGAYVDMGVWDGTLNYGTQMITRLTYPVTDSFVGYVNDANSTYISNTDSRGFFIMNRTSNTQLKLQKNSTINTFTSNLVNKVSNTIWIGARNINSSVKLYSPRECSFASIGDGLTDAEATAFYNAVQTFNTTLSRQV